MVLFEYLVSKNPAFLWAFSVLIGQMAQSIVIGLPLTVHVRNSHYHILISAPEASSALVHSDKNSNDFVSFSLSIPAW